MSIDQNYQQLLQEILTSGYDYEDPNREGVMRKEIDSYTFKHSFKDGFPAISTKKLAFKQVVTELIWFLKGDTNIKYLVDNGCNIWNKDAYKHYIKQCVKDGSKPMSMQMFLHDVKGQKKLRHVNYTFGDLGPVYGYQWIKSSKITPTGSGHYVKKKVNQIQNLIENMISKPMSSELIVNAWNPVDLDEMALQPCHYGFQIIMRPLTEEERQEELEKIYPQSEGVATPDSSWINFVPKYGFTLKWNQRSVDTFLGLPFNIASYALLASILQKITGHIALGIEGDLSKVHLYDNSIEAAKEQISRNCSDVEIKLLLKDEFHYGCDYFTTINDMSYQMEPDWFKLENYEPHSAIKVEMLERTI